VTPIEAALSANLAESGRHMEDRYASHRYELPLAFPGNKELTVRAIIYRRFVGLRYLNLRMSPTQSCTEQRADQGEGGGTQPATLHCRRVWRLDHGRCSR